MLFRSGDMQMTVRSREFAAAPVVNSEVYTFSPTTELIDLRHQARHITMKFESNTLNGDYHMGRVLLHVEPGDLRS